ncbi:MAG: hypothetical protein JOZ57_06165, partial [Abitibacteriaceae bacterium]|nr:hypothetical protein [Abditibacteriaceae bacterium]
MRIFGTIEVLRSITVLKIMEDKLNLGTDQIDQSSTAARVVSPTTISSTQEAPAYQPHTMRIQPSKGWVSLKLDELWEYRELLYFLTWRDIKVRYKQTALGAAWAI